jgi:pimeloyl-ACP methyl ester carboxylesterase
VIYDPERVRAWLGSFRQGNMGLILSILAVYAVICVVAYFGNRQFMYFPDPTRVAPEEVGLDGVEEVEIAAIDGTILIAWQAPAKEGKPTILYFHGNGANAADRAPRIATMHQDGFGVFYLNNRGYGGSGGRPTEEHNVADAIAAYDHLVERGVSPEQIVVYGESLGSGQAVRLAAARSVAAIVLESPLTSTVDVARATYFWLPLRILITDQYNNERNIHSVTAPVLVLHGERDGVIPVEMGQRVYRAANKPKKIELFPHGGHVDLFGHGAWEKTRTFLASLNPTAGHSGN